MAIEAISTAGCIKLADLFGGDRLEIEDDELFRLANLPPSQIDTRGLTAHQVWGYILFIGNVREDLGSGATDLRRALVKILGILGNLYIDLRWQQQVDNRRALEQALPTQHLVAV